jgi:hypothetical protein
VHLPLFVFFKLKPHAHQVNSAFSPNTPFAPSKRRLLEPNLFLGSKQLPEEAFFAEKLLYDCGFNKHTICFLRVILLERRQQMCCERANGIEHEVKDKS